MINYNLKLVTEPVIEPVDVDEVKTHTHIDHTDEDSLIITWIRSATNLAQVYTNRSFITQTYDLSFDGCFPECPIKIPRAPLRSITSIGYYTTDNQLTTISSNDYYLDTDSEPGRITLNYGTYWPAVVLREINSVRIRFVAGYGENRDYVPDGIKDAILLYCTHRNENRASETDDIPKQFYQLLDPYRLYI